MGNPADVRWPRLGCGVGLRPPHIPDLLRGGSAVDWLEIITENFLDRQGLPFRNLEKLRQDFPIVAHGVSLSIASSDPLNWAYLKQVKDFYQAIQPPLISDHLCWTGVDHQNLYQLLPIPRTEEALQFIAERLRVVQDFLGRQLMMENISTYLDFSESVFSEEDFLCSLSQESGCGLLLDITNVYLNGQNHGYDPRKFLESLPPGSIGQFHLSGFVEESDPGRYLFDSHSRTVPEKIWDLYRYCLDRFGPVSTLIEWDADLPEFSILENDVKRAKIEFNNWKNSRESNVLTLRHAAAS